MSDLPRVAICLLTYRRTAEALQTILSTCTHLQYPRELLGWYVGDDGSEAGHHTALLNALTEQGQTLIGHHNERFREDASYYCGRGWNRALGLAHQWTDFVLWLEDDWAMEADLDLTRYVRLLQERPEVGLVTFRILSVDCNVQTTGWDGEIFLKYLKHSTQYAYSGNPLLRHARYTTHYGWFAEDLTPGNIELNQDDKYRFDANAGPEIWRPATLDQWGGWHHTGTQKTWE